MATRTTVEITMPQMGESVTEGTILEWRKQVGDPVDLDEPLVEVSTDKVDTEVPAPVAGTLMKILVQPDETVPVGTVLAEIEVSENGGSQVAGGRSQDEGSSGELVDVEFPQMGDSVTEGTVLEWLKQVGDPVAVEEEIVEISTDKVDAQMPSPVAGTLEEILVQADETVPTGTVLCRIRTGVGAPAAAAAAPSPPTAETAALEGRPQPAPTGNGAKNATPVAARMASAHGVNVDAIQGSGPRGRVTKEDVAAALSGNGAAAPALSPDDATAKPMRGPAATLARFMNESRSIPTATSFRNLTVDELDARRKALKGAGKKLSFTHLIAWAIVEAAREMPVMAHAYAEVDGKPQRVEPAGVSLGLAVDVERKDGSRSLVVPVIQRADSLGFSSFVARYDELVAGARDNTLPPEAYQGANITLTNPGGIGTVASVPRLMPGQGTIVATGAIGYPAGFGAVAPEKLKELGVQKVMTMTSTYDHRVIQGAESGAFLRRIDQLLQGEDGFYDKLFGALQVPVDAAPGGDGAGPVTAAEPAPSGVTPALTGAPDEALLQAVQAATSIVKAHRMHGHLAARLDPLGSEPVGDPALDPATVHLTPELMRAIPTTVLRVAVPGETFAEALPHLQETYCGTIAYEIEPISDHEQRVWLRQTI
ncbi:MAG TPA: 2-oxo acid dehydrogenase subunit E2, partial [Thermoleophilaceae bacterium]